MDNAFIASVSVVTPCSFGAVLKCMKDGRGKNWNFTPRPEVKLECLGQGTSPGFIPSRASSNVITQCTV